MSDIITNPGDKEDHDSGNIIVSNDSTKEPSVEMHIYVDPEDRVGNESNTTRQDAKLDMRVLGVLQQVNELDPYLFDGYSVDDEGYVCYYRIEKLPPKATGNEENASVNARREANLKHATTGITLMPSTKKQATVSMDLELDFAHPVPVWIPNGAETAQDFDDAPVSEDVEIEENAARPKKRTAHACLDKKRWGSYGITAAMRELTGRAK